MMNKRTTYIKAFSQTIGLTGSNSWLWIVCLFGAASIHLGTAVLRVESFFPFPQAIDFSHYYAAAWSIKLNLSPYLWSEDLLKFLSETQNLAAVPTVHNNPPLWSWLLQPITVLSFPSAATLWLCILLLLVACSHVLLVRIAGYNDWKVIIATLPLTLTFGPLFLILTLGQNGVFLLLSVLILGEVLKNKNRSKWFDLLSATLWVVAVSAKIYPALWISCLPLLKRWRTFATAVTLCLVMFGTNTLLEPDIAADYWQDILPNRAKQYSAKVSIDDQSLTGFLSRVGKTNHFSFPGLRIQDMHQVSWHLPWNFSTQSIRNFSILLLLLFGSLLLFSWVRSNFKDPEGIIYSLVLFSLLPFPHMARYNHIVALPAMVWLWRRGTAYRKVAIIAYCMFGLSRLNHLWAILLPAPLGPIASGFGLFGVLVLMLGISNSLTRHSVAASQAR
jgi:hypothetical protein